MQGKKGWPQLSLVFSEHRLKWTSLQPLTAVSMVPCLPGSGGWFLQNLMGWAGSHAPCLLFASRLCLCLLPHRRGLSNLLAAVSRGIGERWKEALWKEAWIPRSLLGVMKDLWYAPFLLQYTHNSQGYFGHSLHTLPCCSLSRSCLPSPSPSLATACAETFTEPFQHCWVLPQPVISFSCLPWNHGGVAHLF